MRPVNLSESSVQHIVRALADSPTIRLIIQKLDNMATDQEHLDEDVQAMGSAFATVISELKAQEAAAVAAAQSAGNPAPVRIDFTKADALVATIQTEATADAPPAPTPATTPDTAAPVAPVTTAPGV